MNVRIALVAPFVAGVVLIVTPLSALAAGSWQWKYYYKPSGIEDFGGMHVANDGQHIAALSSPNNGSKNIYISSNGGASWTTPFSLYGQVNYLQDLVGSADGKYLYLTAYGGAVYPNLYGYVFASSDYGMTWATTTAPSGAWSRIATSYDGGSLIAVRTNNIFTSGDYGASWTAQPELGTRNWTSVDVSADGRMMIASAMDGVLFITRDAGATWSSVYPGASSGTVDLGDAAVSGDGRIMMAALYDNRNFIQGLYVSQDGGVNWPSQPATTSNQGNRFVNTQINYDGSMAVVNNAATSNLYSIDKGQHWQSVNIPYNNAKLLAGNMGMSKNGFFAALPWSSGHYVFTGIYVDSSQTPPTASLSASPTSVTAGQSTTLTWSSTNATFCSSAGFTTDGATADFVSLTPLQSTTYTLSCTGLGGSASAATRVTVSFYVGLRVETSATTNVYTKPQTGQGSKVACSEIAGTLGTVAAGPETDSAGNIWWQVTFDNNCTGWVMDGALKSASGTQPPPPPPPPTSFGIGTRVVTTDALNVRSKAGKAGQLLCTQPLGTLGSIVGGPQKNGGDTWWSINYDTSCDGWSVQDYLALATTAGTNNLAPIGANTNASLSQYASVLLSLQSILSQLKGLAQSVDR